MTPEQIDYIGANVAGVIIVIAVCVVAIMFFWSLFKD